MPTSKASSCLYIEKLQMLHLAVLRGKEEEEGKKPSYLSIKSYWLVEPRSKLFKLEELMTLFYCPDSSGQVSVCDLDCVYFIILPSFLCI